MTIIEMSNTTRVRVRAKRLENGWMDLCMNKLETCKRLCETVAVSKNQFCPLTATIEGLTVLEQRVCRGEMFVSVLL